MNYRAEAIKALKRAKHEMASQDDSRVRYAALELRMALEGLIYEVSKSYQEELSDIDFNTWQPKKLLELLIEIDPTADQSSEWRIGVQNEKGQLPAAMTCLGVDRKLTLQQIKKFYDRLGSYLHSPTIKQLTNNKAPDFTKLQNSCEELVHILENVLTSEMFKTRMKVTSKIDCMACEAKIVRNIPHGVTELTASCRKCGACYTLKSKDATVVWEPKLVPAPCAECSDIKYLFESMIAIGTTWTCNTCKGRNVIQLAVVKIEEGS